MNPTERFAELVTRAPVPLDEVALAIAAHAHPDLDHAAELARLDDLGSRLEHPDRAELCRVLFGEAGLRGNDEDYYVPDNSFINRVLDTGFGIPISLAVLMIEVGRRAGVALVGVNAPSHFLVRDEADGAFLDPFGRGAVVTELAGADAPVADTNVIVARMLNNLRTIYAGNGDLSALIWVLRLRTLLPGAPREAAFELTRAQARLN